MINVTKPYLPSKEKYQDYVSKIFDSAWLTNNGCLAQQLEERITQYLGVKNLILVANGSLALQVAYRALELKNDVITSPFSFVATTSTLVWEKLKPVFSDIDPYTFNIDPANIIKMITPKTCAILPVHVFGNPCNVESIEMIANEHGLKVIYDAAHAFGVNYRGESILNYGHISTLSFHATKLFHTIEGGAVITNDDILAEKVRRTIDFGFSGPGNIVELGINAKMNEFEAAMGLCLLDEISAIRNSRETIWNYFRTALSGYVSFQSLNPNSVWNYSYVPILFEKEELLVKAQKALNERQIYPRQYFNPSLDTLSYLKGHQVCPISRDIAKRILCLPTYVGLELEEVEKIVEIIIGCLKSK